MSLVLCFLMLFTGDEAPRLDPDTGFVVDENLMLVKAHCTGCHSPKLVTQNRGTEEEWRDLIVWMQEEQGLWEIDKESTDKIVAYLARHYGHKEDQNQRRKMLLPVEDEDGDP